MIKIQLVFGEKIICFTSWIR